MDLEILPEQPSNEFTQGELEFLAHKAGIEIEGISSIRPSGGLTGLGLLALQDKFRRILKL